MKIVAFLAGVLSFGLASAQVVLCPGGSIQFQIQDPFYGVPEWQYSADGDSWEALPGPLDSTLTVVPTAPGFYRVTLNDEACDTTYISNEAFVQIVEPIRLITGHTVQQVSLGADLLLSVSRYDELSNIVYHINDVLHPSEWQFDSIPNPMVDMLVWATAEDSSGCDLMSDTLFIPVVGAALRFPMGVPIKTTVVGQVRNERNWPVPGAVVKAGLGDQVTTTDLNGAFVLEDMDGFTSHAFVTVQKDGHSPGSRSFVPVDGRNVLDIVLLEPVNAGTVQAGAASTVDTAGVVLSFDGSFVSNEAAYSGVVEVALAYITPTTPGFQERMPGMLLGTVDSMPQALVSFGMVSVGLTTPDGQKVDLAPGSQAQIRFQVTPDQLAGAPDSIDLWSFNEEVGYWVNEGNAVLVGSEYLAQVSHFSWWNVDLPWPVVSVSGKLVVDPAACGGVLTVPAGQVHIIGDSDPIPDLTYYTSSTGHFSGWFPAGMDLDISTSIACSGNTVQVHNEVMLPLLNDTVLPDIQLDLGQYSIVTGVVVDCNGQPVEAGYVMASGGIHFLTEQGRFTFLACSTTVKVVAYDQTTLNGGFNQTFTLTPGCVDLDTLVACGINLRDTTVTDIDGNTYSTTLIGAQQWISSNLRTSKYRNGESIPYVQSNFNWNQLTTAAWSYPDGLVANDAIYGKYYNFHVISDTRGVCPAGWRVPSDTDWKQLELTLGMLSTELNTTGHRGAAANVGGKLKSTTLWQAPNTGATNATRFNGSPGGYRSSGGTQVDIGVRGLWWTGSGGGGNTATVRYLYNNYGTIYRDISNRANGFCIRCIRDL